MGTVATTILAAGTGSGYEGAIAYNGGVNTIYVEPGTAAGTATGIPVAPGASFSFRRQITEAVSAIAVTAAQSAATGYTRVWRQD